MYALVEIKGKQYKAEKGKRLTIDLCDAKEGEILEFPVLLTSDSNGKVEIGTPHLSGKVKVKVEGSFRDKKIVVYKYNKRKGYRRTMGHRQSYTTVLVEEIQG